jgi:hypothetical protein
MARRPTRLLAVQTSASVATACRRSSFNPQPPLRDAPLKGHAEPCRALPGADKRFPVLQRWFLGGRASPSWRSIGCRPLTESLVRPGFSVQGEIGSMTDLLPLTAAEEGRPSGQHEAGTAVLAVKNHRIQSESALGRHNSCIELRDDRGNCFHRIDAAGGPLLAPAQPAGRLQL